MTPEELTAKEAAEKAAKEAEAAAAAEAAQAKKEQEADAVAEIAALKSQIAELNAKLETKATPSNNLTEEQWQQMEERWGMPRNQIIAVNTMIQADKSKLEKALSDIQADRQFERVKSRISRNYPQWGKIEEHFDSYFDDLPAEAKTDPEKLKRHSERALAFALSKLPAKKKEAEEETPVKKTRLHDDDNPDEDEFFSELHHTADHSFRMKPKKMISDDRRKETRHPEVENRVLIPTEKDWEKKEKEYEASKK